MLAMISFLRVFNKPHMVRGLCSFLSQGIRNFMVIQGIPQQVPIILNVSFVLFYINFLNKIWYWFFLDCGVSV
jgi:hypothetical protein